MRLETAIIAVLLGMLLFGVSGTRSHPQYADYAAGRCTLTSSPGACAKFVR